MSDLTPEQFLDAAKQNFAEVVFHMLKHEAFVLSTRRISIPKSQIKGFTINSVIMLNLPNGEIRFKATGAILTNDGTTHTVAMSGSPFVTQLPYHESELAYCFDPSHM